MGTLEKAAQKKAHPAKRGEMRMSASRDRNLLRWLVGGSTIAMAPGIASAQGPQAAPVGQSPTEEQRPATANLSQAEAPPAASDAIVVTGIRASLRPSRAIKQNAIAAV